MNIEGAIMKEPIDIVRKYRNIPEIFRYTFWCTFFAGMLTHLYILTNKLPTFDDMLCLNSFGGSFELGRWFLGIMGLVKYKVLGNYSMPMLNGTLAIFLIAVFACLVNVILENDNVLVAVLTGIMLMVFPTVAGNLSFMFTGYYYSFAMILLGMGVLLIKRGKNVWMFIFGSFMLTLSLGIYQAYYPLGIGLFLISLVFDCLREDKDFREIFCKAMKYLAGLLLGLAFYFPLDRLWLKIMHMERGSHKGMSQMGQLPLKEMPGRIVQTYRAFIQMFSGNYYGMTGNVWIRLVIILLLAALLFLLIRKSMQILKQRRYLVCVLLWVIIALLPIGIHSIYIMVEEQYLYTLMIYADVLLFIFPLVLSDRIVLGEKVSEKISKVTGIVNWLVTLAVVFSGIFYVYQDNAAYLEAELSLSATKSYYTTLITQVKSLEGYREDMEVVLIGENQDRTIYEIRKEFFQDVEVGGIYETDRVVRGIDQGRFMKYYCGFDQSVTEDVSGIEKTVWTDMPDYPNEGAIRIIRDKILIKFSDAE